MQSMQMARDAVSSSQCMLKSFAYCNF